MATNPQDKGDHAADLASEARIEADRLAATFLEQNVSLRAVDATLRARFAAADDRMTSFAEFESFRALCQTAIDRRLDREAANAAHPLENRCLCCGSTDNVTADLHSALDQSLCTFCSGVSSGVDFFAVSSALTAAPTELPAVTVAPLSGHIGDGPLREQSLRRWINQLYQCAAVDELLTTGELGQLAGVKLRLRPGNDRSWLAPHLKWTIGQINSVEPAGETEPPMPQPPEAVSPDPVADAAPAGQTSLKDVLKSVADVERFFIRVLHRDGRRVRGNLSREIEPYPFENALNGDKTVDFWKTTRFLGRYPMFDNDEYIVQVLGGDGSPCAGQTKVRNVRESYEG